METKTTKHLWEREPIGIDPEMLDEASNVFKSFDDFIEWVDEASTEDGNPCVIQSENCGAFIYWEWVPSIEKAKKNKQDYYLENYEKAKGKPHKDEHCLRYYKKHDYLIIVMQNLLRYVSTKTIYKITVTEEDEPKVIECFNKMKKYMNDTIYRF